MHKLKMYMIHSRSYSYLFTLINCIHCNIQLLI